MKKNKVIVGLLIIVFVLACSTTCSTNVKFRIIDYKFHSNGVKSIRMLIPEGYEQQSIAGSHELEQRFWYSDSAVIYITNDKGVSELNYHKIHKFGDPFYKRQFRADTLTLSGIQNNLYWKDVKYPDFSVGYANVPYVHKQIFEQALQSVNSLNHLD